MRIVTPTTIERVAWEGKLEQAGQIFRDDSASARVSLGEPVVWMLDALKNQVGKKWAQPLGDLRYMLIRLSLTLHSLDDTSARFAEATLTTYFRSQSGVGNVFTHDLYPQRITAASSGTIKIAVKPDLKFVEAIKSSPGDVGVEIEHHNVFPVVQAFGLRQSNPYWKFSNHAANPLIGCQSIYLVLAVSHDAEGARLSIELSAKVESRLGMIHVRLPEPARTQLSRTIE
ncbi:hypothetical protein ANRL1_00065 [Anaerolineae bacterium]|nr:hypothetical protein ANRL1_00065 [Anaerolineae bacterium]